jgi:hypothetical protein
VDAVTPLVPEEAVPYVGEALRRLRAEVGGEAAVLGFVGAPFTLATYIVEGGMSKSYTHIKTLMYTQPQVCGGWCVCGVWCVWWGGGGRWQVARCGVGFGAGRWRARVSSTRRNFVGEAGVLGGGGARR